MLFFFSDMNAVYSKINKQFMGPPMGAVVRELWPSLKDPGSNPGAVLFMSRAHGRNSKRRHRLSGTGQGG